jgi:hypothetical protein
MMRDRDRWEQWLRTEISSLPLGQGVDTVTAWAVASMVATYANADGSGITVSTNVLRQQMKIGKAKLDRTLQWLEDSGVLTTTAKHGRGTPTRRALLIPPAGSNGTTQGGPIKPPDERTTQGGPVNPPDAHDERTTQGSPVNPGLNGPATGLNGPVTSFERTSNPVRHPFDRTAQGGPQPVNLTKEIPGGGGPPAHPREAPAATVELEADPGPEPRRRCRQHADEDPGHPCLGCKGARMEWERWKRASDRWAERPGLLPPECGQCDARPGDPPSARMIDAGGLCLKCPRCHPESIRLKAADPGNDHGIRRSD